MRRVLSGLVLVLFSVGGFGAMHRLSVQRVETKLGEERAALTRFEVKHTLPSPVHDDGLQCLRLLLDVTPPDVASAFEVTPKELSDEVRAQVQATSPWARGLRECANSARLRYVGGGLGPDAPQARAKDVLRKTLPRLFRFTEVELRLVLEEKQPALALERCTEALALAADLSHVGADGVTVLRNGLEALAPACARALAASSTEERAAAAKAWAALPSRLASPAQVVAYERLAGMVRWFEPALAQPFAQARQARAAVSFDEAMRAVETAQPGPARVEAAAKAKAATGQADFSIERTLEQRDEAEQLLTLLLALALDDQSARPGVTRSEDAVTFTPAQGAPVVLPRKAN